MTVAEIILRFIAGGVIVVLVSLLARSNHPFLAGLFVLFPAVTLVSFFFLVQSSSSDIIHKVSLLSIYAYPTTLAFLVTFFFSHSKLGNYSGLCISVAVWLLVALLLAILNMKFFHIGT